MPKIGGKEPKQRLLEMTLKQNRLTKLPQIWHVFMVVLGNIKLDFGRHIAR